MLLIISCIPQTWVNFLIFTSFVSFVPHLVSFVFKSTIIKHKVTQRVTQRSIKEFQNQINLMLLKIIKIQAGNAFNYHLQSGEMDEFSILRSVKNNVISNEEF
jgi:hypothetical protein